MTKRQNHSQGPKDLRRGRPRYPSSGKAFLIVTEGKKTEPNYFTSLRIRLQLSATDVEILHPDGTDPMTLVTKAIELRDERKRNAKKGLKIPYDEVWIVYDLEKPHDERREVAKNARGMKGASEIRFAESDPCFEVWLLFHDAYTTSQFADCEAVVQRLKTNWPDYSKGGTPSEEFLSKLPTAISNAQKCREHHKASNGDGNPGTNVDILASNLNLATRPHLRIPPDKV